MRYSLKYSILIFLELFDFIDGDLKILKKRSAPTKDYNYFSDMYNNLSSLSNQIVQNSNGNEQAQNLQNASNLTQQFWDPGNWQYNTHQRDSRYPYGSTYQRPFPEPEPLGYPPKKGPSPKKPPPPPPKSSDEKSYTQSYDDHLNHQLGELNDKYGDLKDNFKNWKKEQEEEEERSKRLALGLGLGIGIPAVLAILVGIFFLYRRYKRRKANSLEGVYNPNSPIISTMTKTSNSYTGSWEPPISVPDDQWIMERDNVVIEYEKKLGSGAFCNVYQGRIIGDAPIKKIYSNMIAVNKFTQCDVAIKMLPSFADDIARSDFNQEINFMKSLRYHPHLVSMLGYVPDFRSPLLIVEFCSQGDLLHLIRERKYEIANGYENQSRLKIKDLVSFSWQISNGLEYLNSVGCIHRDVAARNVLVDESNTCKIGDFGLCRLTDNLLYTARGGRLPLRWMAPESLKSFEYSFKSDVWSYGILLYELFSLGEVPYSTIENGHLLDFLERGDRLPKPVYCPDEIYEVMQKCWQFLPVDRLSFTEICQTFIRILENATTEYGYVQPVPDEPNQEVDDV